MIPRVVFSDFDGTLTSHTDLTVKFFEILNLLSDHKIPLVIVTGRSISWGHFLLTHFPQLKHVICEGGGVLVKRKQDGVIAKELYVDEKEVTRLQNFTKSLLKKFKGLELSADSLGRLTDRAIELSDLMIDVDRMKDIKTFMDKENVNYSQSNVHLNFWCGEISKYKSVSEFMKKYYKEYSLEQTIFFGDSMNDESMFKDLPHTVGVSNIKEVLKKLNYEPSVVLTGEENAGPQGVYNHLESLLK